jgi:hypothetical protein
LQNCKMVTDSECRGINFHRFRAGSGVLVRTTNSGASSSWGRGAKKASGVYDFDPGAFPNLYKIAHSETTVDKSNNSTSGFPQTILARAMFDVGYFPPDTPPGTRF